MEYTFGVNNKLDDIYNGVPSFLNLEYEDKIFLKNYQKNFKNNRRPLSTRRPVQKITLNQKVTTENYFQPKVHFHKTTLFLAELL